LTILNDGTTINSSYSYLERTLVLSAQIEVNQSETGKNLTALAYAKSIGFSMLEKLPKSTGLSQTLNYLGEIGSELFHRARRLGETFNFSFETLSRDPQIQLFKQNEQTLLDYLSREVLDPCNKDEISRRLKGVIENYLPLDTREHGLSREAYRSFIWPTFCTRMAAIAGVGVYVAVEAGSIERGVSFVREQLPGLSFDTLGLLGTPWLSYGELGPNLLSHSFLQNSPSGENASHNKELSNMRSYLESLGVLEPDYSIKYAVRG